MQMCKTHEYSFIKLILHLHVVMCFLLCINRNMEDVDTGVKDTTIICEDLHTFKKSVFAVSNFTSLYNCQVSCIFHEH